MMKRYLISEVVTAQPMTYHEACAQYEKIGTLASDVKLDTPGFILCHIRPLQFEWVPESAFCGVPFDNDLDILRHYSAVLEEIAEHIKKYSKSATEDKKNAIYNINRHFKSIKWNFKKLLNQ